MNCDTDSNHEFRHRHCVSHLSPYTWGGDHSKYGVTWDIGHFEFSVLMKRAELKKKLCLIPKSSGVAGGGGGVSHSQMPPLENPRVNKCV